MTHININLLCTIPGIDRRSAITIISEIGTDMSQFGSSKRLCCWASLTPGNNESAGKKKSVRISRVGVYLKPALVQVAHAVVKDNDHPYYSACVYCSSGFVIPLYWVIFFSAYFNTYTLYSLSSSSSFTQEVAGDP